MQTASGVKVAMSAPPRKPSKKEKRDEIVRQLKDAYQDVVDEPLPPSFKDLLRQLDEKSDTTKGK